LSEFNAHGAEFLVVGAYAMAAHGRVGTIGDFDVWVRLEAAGRSQDRIDIGYLRIRLEQDEQKRN
jgi:hypothetical protein